MSVALALDSPRWAELAKECAGAELPALLKRLAAGDEAALPDVYVALVNQVGAASIAAFPHVVAFAGDATPDWGAQLLVLAGGIRSGAAELPAELRAAYDEAVPRAARKAEALLPFVEDPNTALYLLQAAAAFRGFATLGGELQGLIDEELTIDCPACRAELYVWPRGEASLEVAAEDPVEHKATRFTPIEAPRELSPGHAEQRKWIAEKALSAALARYRGQLDALFGRGTCPACEAPFSLIERLDARTIS